MVVFVVRVIRGVLQKKNNYFGGQDDLVGLVGRGGRGGRDGKGGQGGWVCQDGQDDSPVGGVVDRPHIAVTSGLSVQSEIS